MHEERKEKMIQKYIRTIYADDLKCSLQPYEFVGAGSRVLIVSEKTRKP
jgi:hypothetical protein